MTWAAFCALIGATVAGPGPAPLTAADAVRAALADVRRLDAATAEFTRYLSLHHLPPAERPEALAVLGYHVNGLSREGVIVRPRAVTPWLAAVDLRDYGVRQGRFGRLLFGKGAVEPYFHVILEPRLNDQGEPNAAAAPWLAAGEIAALIAATQSQVPIVRADWFVYRTAMVEGRDDDGYYAFLELKSRADAEQLAGLDRKAAEKLFREQAGVIDASGVALQPRQLFRYSTVSGAWWESRDVKAESAGQGGQSAARLRLGDFKHDAEEIVFTLPNRLPAYYLSDAGGGQVKSAPPDIASDGKATSNDRRVHASLSCVRCHTRGGLIPFDDLLRRQYEAGGPLAEGSPDAALARRLRSVYLGPIQRAFDRDAKDFADAIAEASGLRAEALAGAYARQWHRYAEQPVDAARAAAEVGLAEADFLARLKTWAATARLVDPVLARYLMRRPEPMQRGQWEELFPLVMGIVGNPGGRP